ncbi:MAG: DUF971 domain-containing protein [Nitrospiria bacterium]
MSGKSATPTEIEALKKDGLRIRWADGHEAVYPYPFLRESCQCASCVDEWSGVKKISRAQIADGIRTTSIEAKGRYAVSIHWSDGHDTGIYPFDYLRKICPCAVCGRENP